MLMFAGTSHSLTSRRDEVYFVQIFAATSELSSNQSFTRFIGRLQRTSAVYDHSVCLISMQHISLKLKNCVQFSLYEKHLDTLSVEETRGIF